MYLESADVYVRESFLTINGSYFKGSLCLKGGDIEINSDITNIDYASVLNLDNRSSNLYLNNNLTIPILLIQE